MSAVIAEVELTIILSMDFNLSPEERISVVNEMARKHAVRILEHASTSNTPLPSGTRIKKINKITKIFVED